MKLRSREQTMDQVRQRDVAGRRAVVPRPAPRSPVNAPSPRPRSRLATPLAPLVVVNAGGDGGDDDDEDDAEVGAVFDGGSEGRRSAFRPCSSRARSAQQGEGGPGADGAAAPILEGGQVLIQTRDGTVYVATPVQSPANRAHRSSRSAPVAPPTSSQQLAAGMRLLNVGALASPQPPPVVRPVAIAAHTRAVRAARAPVAAPMVPRVNQQWAMDDDEFPPPEPEEFGGYSMRAAPVDAAPHILDGNFMDFSGPRQATVNALHNGGDNLSSSLAFERAQGLLKSMETVTLYSGNSYEDIEDFLRSVHYLRENLGLSPDETFNVFLGRTRGTARLFVEGLKRDAEARGSFKVMATRLRKRFGKPFSMESLDRQIRNLKQKQYQSIDEYFCEADELRQKRALCLRSKPQGHQDFWKIENEDFMMSALRSGLRKDLREKLNFYKKPKTIDEARDLLKVHDPILHGNLDDIMKDAEVAAVIQELTQEHRQGGAPQGWNRLPNQGQKSRPCLCCGETDHSTFKCPHVICYKCNKNGHMAKDCQKVGTDSSFETSPKNGRVGEE
jgi:hypothetical protein